MVLDAKNVILVLSGKGGVGKSTVSVLLSLSLAHSGCRVGLLDIDLCGPSIPKMLGLQGSKITQSDKGWIPVQKGNLSVISIGFLLEKEDDAVVWRGPKKNSLIQQFVSSVDWGHLDFLIIDTPPGTSDEHLSVVELFRNSEPFKGAVIVTTPQNVALSDVRKEIQFCRTSQVPLIGIVENMSGYCCPHCHTISNVFSTKGGEALANHANIPFLGRLAWDANFITAIEQGSILESFEHLEMKESFKKISDLILEYISI